VVVFGTNGTWLVEVVVLVLSTCPYCRGSGEWGGDWIRSGFVHTQSAPLSRFKNFPYTVGAPVATAQPEKHTPARVSSWRSHFTFPCWTCSCRHSTSRLQPALQCCLRSPLLEVFPNNLEVSVLSAAFFVICRGFCQTNRGGFKTAASLTTSTAFKG